ncbi:MAG: DUF4837 family protein [Bacteroidales bacterium]|nr:DUF4837 family protein [Bacteroidales bacterium]
MILNRFKTLTYLMLMVLFLMTSVQCTRKSGKSNLPRSIGNTSEVMVVLQNQEQWDGIVGQTIREVLGKEQYGLPQVEPLFKLSHIPVTNFSDLFKKHRNILIVELKPDATESKMEIFSDQWASPQRIFRITSQNASSFSELFFAHSDEIIQAFGEAERQRIMEVFNPTSNNDASEAIFKKYGMVVNVPSGFYMAKSVDGFMWLRKEVPDYSQGIVIISEPYVSEKQFNPESIIARTNRELMQHVPGSSEGSFMIIDSVHVLPVTSQVTNFPFEYTIEMRGMWNVANDFMGGPFVSYTFTGNNNQTIYTLFGYVYYPNQPKRDLLRQVEAILYSARQD